MSATEKLNTGRSSEFVDGSSPSVSGLVDGILSGSIIAGAGAMQVQSSSLTVIRNGASEAIPNQSVNVTAADATNPRVDMVQWDGATLSVKAGTPASISTMNAPTPDANNIPLALIFIYPNGTTIRNMGLQDASGQFNAIFAYYYARRGLYAALLARQDSSVSSALQADPVVALPVYHPRTGVVSISYDGSVVTAGGAIPLGVFVTLHLDAVNIIRSQCAQRYIESPLATIASNAEAQVNMKYSRGNVSSGVHRWTPMVQVSNNPSSLVYRQMELQEIL